jgi:8-oxo-dGTP pyrophosphatase MutT (NUDIX family)
MMSDKVKFEFSAGGIVYDPQTKKLFLIQVKNLQGDVVWTFPKGHIEKGETAEQAALREVQEETGWTCAIEAPFHKAQYWFKKDGCLIKKSVTWFLMKPEVKSGTHDPEEIMGFQWAAMPEARALISYRSDADLLDRMKERIERHAGL